MSLLCIGVGRVGESSFVYCPQPSFSCSVTRSLDSGTDPGILGLSTLEWVGGSGPAQAEVVFLDGWYIWT